MENCDFLIHLKDHHYGRKRRTSARQAQGAQKSGARSKCPCCREDQVRNVTPGPQQSAAKAKLPQKRKRRSEPSPNKPSAEHPEKLNLVPRPLSAIPPAELPVVSDVLPSPRPSTADNQLNSTAVNDDSPLRIHNYSVEDYQQIYHEVVDDMLRYKNGRTGPYSLGLGLRIKQKLWERLNRPTMTVSESDGGLMRVDISYGVGSSPPLHNIDTLGEPSPAQPPSKRAKNSK